MEENLNLKIQGNNKNLSIILISLCFLFCLTLWIVIGMPPAENINLFFILGTFTFLSLTFLGVTLCKNSQEDNEERFTPKGMYDEDPKLITVGGIGSRFYRVPNHPYVKYRFICFLYFPLIPIECYYAKSEGRGYQWYGYAKWNTQEIIGLYLMWFGGIPTVMFLLYSIYSIFNL